MEVALRDDQAGRSEDASNVAETGPTREQVLQAHGQRQEEGNEGREEDTSCVLSGSIRESR